jgi:hypothetical protein
MNGWEQLLVEAATAVITLFVPAAVWLLLAAGLLQLAVTKLRQIHVVPLGMRRSPREGLS